MADFQADLGGGVASPHGQHSATPGADQKRWIVNVKGHCRGAAADALYWRKGGAVPSPVECWQMAATFYLKLCNHRKTRGSAKALAPNFVFETV
jgi:hypothetical protein